MTWLGLSPAHVAEVWGAAAVVVGGLYLLKLRRRVIAVPFSPLWQTITRDKESSALFSKLKQLLSVLLQLALLALLALALGDPRLAEGSTGGRTLVVLLDASASMQATDVLPSRLAVARDAAKKLLAGLGGSDRALVARMDATVTPMGPLTDDVQAAQREVDAVTATDAPADFPRALRFATDVLRGAPRGEIVVVSDGALGPASDASGPVHLGTTKVSYVRVGREGRNVGITQFSVRRYPLDKNRYEVMLELYNGGSADEDVELQLMGDGVLVDVVKVHLAVGERVPRFYPQLSGARRTLEARIQRADGTHDDLAADDRAFALLPEKRRAKVLVVSAGNRYLEAALLLDEYLDVTDVAPARYAYALGERRYDAVIFDGVTPEKPPLGTPALYLDPRGPGSPVKVDRELARVGFDKVDRKHPIAAFLSLDDVNVAKAHKLVPQGDDRVVGAAEGGASPVLVAGERWGAKFVALGFDVRDSDLPLRPSWPLFVVDCIDWFSGQDAQYLSGYRTGEVWRIPVDATDHATVRGPDGVEETVAVHEGRAVLQGERAGIYDVLASGPGPAGAPAASTSFAGNLLDPAESTIGAQARLAVDGRDAGDPAAAHAGVRRELWVALLAAVLMLSALEWVTYHRRWTT